VNHLQRRLPQAAWFQSGMMRCTHMKHLITVGNQIGWKKIAFVKGVN
jgi:hypothetical protein